jgi:NAD(P)-dependent dehydrogenase (short-subunit alcohol dehydrogenase family)
MTGTTRGVVLITGASKGIGRLCAERLATEGWRVFGAARTGASVDNVEMIQMDADDDASVAAGHTRWGRVNRRKNPLGSS